MEYLLLNATFEASSVIESLMDDTVLKTVPFGSKFKAPILTYNDILIPIIPTDMNDVDFFLKEGRLANHVKYANLKQDIIYSVYVVFKEVLDVQKSMLIDILAITNTESIGLIYSDGSSSKIKSAAGFGICKLTEQSTAGTFDDFTGLLWEYETLSGRIENGTNNVGELSGVRAAINNFNDKKIQVVISDNIYALKSFREYIYVWKNNGYLTYSKKPIKNKELIQETYSELLEVLKDKIVLFKWTKGHDGDSFNEICDELAKKESGVLE